MQNSSFFGTKLLVFNAKSIIFNHQTEGARVGVGVAGGESLVRAVDDCQWISKACRRLIDQKMAYLVRAVDERRVGLGLHGGGDLGPLLHGRVDPGRVVRARVPEKQQRQGLSEGDLSQISKGVLSSADHNMITGQKAEV